MKSIKILLPVFILFSFSINTFSQLWKVHADSAKIFNEQKKYDKAIEFYSLAKEELSKDSSGTNGYAEISKSLAILFFNKAKYDTAMTYYNEAKIIKGNILGKENPEYASLCSNIAVICTIKGQYDMAESLHLEALKIRAVNPGKEHPDYAASCNNLAILYKKMGQFKKAEPLYLEAKRIREINPERNYLEYAGSCNSLASYYQQMSKYELAESLYLQAKQMMETQHLNKHRYYASICNNLALLYGDIGQYEKAEQLLLQSKKLDEELIGKENAIYASVCDNLANLYWKIENYSSAENLYIEAKQLRKKIFDNKHPEYANSCDNLAALYTSTHQYEKAEPLFLEAKQIRKEKLTIFHPDYATSCNNLAAYYLNLEQFKKAEPLFYEAKQINERIFGKEHPTYPQSCINLGFIYFTLNKDDRCDYLFKESFHSNSIQVKKFFQFTGEAEKLAYLKNTFELNEKLVSFYSFNYASFKQGFNYNISTFSRNLILQSSQQLRKVIYYTNDSGIKDKYKSWVEKKEQLAFWYTKSISERSENVKRLEEQTSDLEKELTRLSFAFKKEQLNNNITWKNIQQSLKSNEASIEFVEYQYYNGKRWTDSTYCIALVLRKDKPEPILIRLFEKKQLDSLLSRSDNQSIENSIHSLYSGNQLLYNLVWKPIEKHLTGISKIYFASTGNLFKISFAALPVNDKQVLGDKYKLVQLNTTATITDNAPVYINNRDKLQLYGGISYDADTTLLKQVTARYHSDISSLRSLTSDLERGSDFQYLPGTKKETEGIKSQATGSNFTINFLSGENATEESFKSLSGKSSPSVLHIATHGFFFPDPKEDKKDNVQKRFETSGKAFKQSDNPLFRSGLLFAGANYAWNGKSIEGIEDGILTAYEVSNMYLPNTKLVVLSACETALGDIQGSEGVYGLQRSFKMAGVQNLVMSLWKVPDAETAEFMQWFYKNLFAKQNISDAFYNAQQTMKNKYRNEPYKWAAWVLVR